jgi:hypothetical protein
MAERINHHRAPMKRPAKRPYLAGKAFAEEAKKQEKKAKKHAVRKLDSLRKEIIQSKGRNNQEHFAFATGIIGGGIAANFIAFQTDGAMDIPAKMLTAITVSGLILGLNKNFFFTSGVYTEMLRQTNELTKQAKDKDTPTQKIPEFKELFDDSTKIRKDKKKNKVKLKSRSNIKTANAAVIIITSIALANLGFSAYEKIQSQNNTLGNDATTPTQVSEETNSEVEDNYPLKESMKPAENPVLAP